MADIRLPETYQRDIRRVLRDQQDLCRLNEEVI